MYTKKSLSNASIFWVSTNHNRLQRWGSLHSNLQMNNHVHTTDRCRDNAAASVAKACANMHGCAMETNVNSLLIYTNVVSTLDECTLRPTGCRNMQMKNHSCQTQ